MEHSYKPGFLIKGMCEWLQLWGLVSPTIQFIWQLKEKKNESSEKILECQNNIIITAAVYAKTLWLSKSE